MSNPPSPQNPSPGSIADINSTSGDYAVGYRHPPLNTRFKKGHSANPKGRRPGQQNLQNTFERVMHQRVPVRQGKKVKMKPMWEAILDTHGRKAANGDVRSASIVVSLVKAWLARERDVESRSFGGKGEPHSIDSSGSSLFANVDGSLLSEGDKIELAGLAETIDLGGDWTALSESQFARVRDIVNKARGKNITSQA
jgi:hypothetical protein